MNLPPTIELLLDAAVAKPSSRSGVAKIFSKSLCRELKEQADWTLARYSYSLPQSAETSFIASPVGVSLPFGKIGKCTAHSGCVDELVKTFGTNAALFADLTVIADCVTPIFLDPAPHDDTWRSDAFVALRAIKYLEPLLRAGVIVCGRPVTTPTSELREVRTTAEAVVADLSQGPITARLVKGRGGTRILLEVPELRLNPKEEFWLDYALGKHARQLQLALERHVGYGKSVDAQHVDEVKQCLCYVVEHNLTEITDSILFATKINAVIWGRQRLELRYIANLLGSTMPVRELDSWEADRLLALPMIRNLTADELLILRSEAKTALPNLRALLADAFRENDREGAVETIMRNLRSQVAEVELELNEVARLYGTRYRSAMQALACAFVLYSLSAGMPAITATAIGALLATLAHTHTSVRTEAKDAAALKTRPAYALVTAKQLFAARPNSR
jgi:hypothetical protein